MPNSRAHIKRFLWGGIILVGVILLSYRALPYWSESRSIDVLSGRIRSEKRLFGMKVREVIHATRFSRSVDSSVQPEWSPFMYHASNRPISPHFSLHSAPHELDVLAMQLERMPANRRREYVAEALETLKARDLDRLYALVKRARIGNNEK